MGQAPRLSVLIADDHALVRDGLKRVINEQPDMTVVAQAGNGHDALALARSMSPGVALIDVSMPGWDGVTLAAALAAECPDLRIVAVTRHTDPAFVHRMLDAGASGYVLKQSPSTELIQAVRAVASGAHYLDSALASGPAPPSEHLPPVIAARRREHAPLTSAEEDVLRLVALAFSNQEIAARLAMDAGEVVSTRAMAMSKAGLRSRVEVIAYAQARGWQ